MTDYPRLPETGCQGPLPSTDPYHEMLVVDSSEIGEEYILSRGCCVLCTKRNGWRVGPLGLYIPAKHGWDSPVEFWQARRVDGGEPRYLSSRAPRGDTLVFMTYVRQTFVFVCEGPMDALALCHGGQAIAVMGNHIPHVVLGRLCEAVQPFQEVIFAVDADSRGVFSEVAAMLALSGKIIRFQDPYPRKDPADLP